MKERSTTYWPTFEIVLRDDDNVDVTTTSVTGRSSTYTGLKPSEAIDWFRHWQQGKSWRRRS